MPTIWTLDIYDQRKEFEAEPFYGFLLLNREHYLGKMYQMVNYPYELFTPDGLISIMDYATVEEAKNAVAKIDLIPPTMIKVVHSDMNKYIGQIGNVFCYSRENDCYLVAVEDSLRKRFKPIGWYPAEWLRFVS